MSKVLEKDLEFGVEYWFDPFKNCSGIFVKRDKGIIYFKSDSSKNYKKNEEGLIGFNIEDDCVWEKVESNL